MSKTCTHPDTKHRQVDDPVGDLFPFLSPRRISSMESFVFYLIVARPAFRFPQAFVVVQHGAFRTEAAFPHGRAAN